MLNFFKSSLISNALVYTSKIIVDTECVIFLCLVFKPKHQNSFLPCLY